MLLSWNWREWLFSRYKLSDQQALELLQKKYGFFELAINSGETILLIPRKYFKACIPRQARLYSQTGQSFLKDRISKDEMKINNADTILPYGFSVKDRKTLVYIVTTLILNDSIYPSC